MREVAAGGSDVWGDCVGEAMIEMHPEMKKIRSGLDRLIWLFAAIALMSAVGLGIVIKRSVQLEDACARRGGMWIDDKCLDVKELR